MVGHRRLGAIPGSLIAAHLEAVTESDPPVVQAAIAALVRRWSFASRDELVVATRPRGTLFGIYTMRDRPYRTLLERLWAMPGACDCPDFVRSSLGLCKHLLVVLVDVFTTASAKELLEEPMTGRCPRLVWQPVLPAKGMLDRAAGLAIERASDLPKTLVRHLDSEGHLRIEMLPDLASRTEMLSALARAGLETTPSAQRVLDEELVEARRLLGCEAHVASALDALASLKRALYPYQKDGVRRFLERGRLLLADDMGLGKTTQAIAGCHALFETGRIEKGLVISPASLKSQWVREWNATTNVPIRVVDGSPSERRRLYEGTEKGFLVLGYEQLLRDFDYVKGFAADMVVLDEAQRIKNYATKSAAFVKALSPEYRLVLTGTPMENRLEELASILDWIDDVALAPKWRLDAAYGVHDEEGAKVGARNLDTLRERIAGCTIRRVRREVLRQLPSRTDTRVPVEMTAQQRHAHDNYISAIAQLAQKAKRRPLTQPEFLRLMQMLTTQRIISNGLAQADFETVWPTCLAGRPEGATLEGLFAPKLAVLQRLIEELVELQGRKVVIFSQWRRMLQLAEWAVRPLLARNGARAVFFTGAETLDQRTQAVADFHDDPRVSVMFLTDAGGVGLNLQRAANACINLELPWNPAVREQRIGRIHRLGQPMPIDVFDLVSEYGIETRIAGILGAKQALFDGVFDGTTDEVSFDGASSFAKRLEKLIDIDVVSPEDDGDGDDDVIDAMIEGDATAIVPASQTESLLGRVMVTRTADGGLRLEAPPDVAHALLEAFEAMKRTSAS